MIGEPDRGMDAGLSRGSIQAMRKFVFRSTSLAAICVVFAQTVTIQAQTQPARPPVRTQVQATPVPTQPAPTQVNTSGQLQRGDSTLDSGEFYDNYTLQARAGQRLDIRLSSQDFDPYIIVRGPGDARFDNDDEGEGSTNARIDEIAPATGTYRIMATSYQPGESGSYRLQASAGGSGDPVARAAPPANRQSGTLAQGDARLDSGEFSDAYTINGRAGDVVDIRLNSGDFDTYLLLRGPDGSSFDNDDADGRGTNSQLRVTLPANGSYRLVVTSYQSGESGAYVLETTGATTVAAASSGGNGSSIGGAANGRTLAVGTPVAGQLSSSDPQLDSGEYFDVYTLSGEPGTQFVVEMQSSAVDTYLAAIGSGGYEVSNDDDPTGQNGTNSRLEITIPDSGELNIAATSYAGEETGGYTLVAQLAGSSARAQANVAGTSLTLGQTITGALTASDPDNNGTAEDTYLLNVDGNAPVRLALSSDAFDTVLRIEGPGGFSAENDDAPGGSTLNSVLDTTLRTAGTYRVIVTSYSAAGLGAYRLEAGGGSGAAGLPAGAGTLALGSQLNGALANGDETISSGEFTDTYRFEGTRGQRVTFDMASTDFDTYLSLQFPGGGQEQNDDRAGGEGTTDSRLTVTLPEDGVYQLVATSYQPGETGGYEITMREADASEASANPSRPNSRVFALNVGVADYERMSPLNLTDQDATKLTEALQATGMMAGESVTLINAQATRENFAAAIAQIAASIGPDDLFLLFFSGHGDKNDVSRDVERDGSSETIELFDASVSDFELAQMIEPITARTLLVLDSCFSGGFDDVINQRIGRMGVFSSDSDLTSLVADKFEAGGYISHILQLAVEGQADTNHDAAITAGELSEFMRTTFYRIALSEPLDATVYGAGGDRGSGYQHIVVNRGGDGMPYEEVLVNLTPGAQISSADPASERVLARAD